MDETFNLSSAYHNNISAIVTAIFTKVKDESKHITALQNLYYLDLFLVRVSGCIKRPVEQPLD